MLYTQKVETLEPFSSHVIPMKTMEAYLGECLNVMVQALYIQDGTLLPGLTMQNTYTELRKGSRKAVVVQYGTTSPIPKLFGQKTASGKGDTCAVTTPRPPNLRVYQFQMKHVLTFKLRKLMIRQRHGKLFNELDLSGLASWAPKLADKACQLLAEYHDVFSC